MLQQKKSSGIIVFYSYAPVDRELRDRLADHLSQLKRDGLIEEWSDQEILAGTNRAQEVDQAIRSAKIILLLISADFLASDTHYHIEMQHALERHWRGEARIIPIIVRPCDWQDSPFAHLQCLPRNTRPITTWENEDEAFLSIAQELRRIIAQQQFPISPLSYVQRQNRERLLKRVRATWIEGLLEQSLHRAVWIDLHLQEQPDALENPWQLEVQELDQTPHILLFGTSIVEVYDEANGELLILGEPGAGKTTLLLELTRTLLERAEKDERLPLPIVFNLSSWAEKRQSLKLWLVEELSTKYQVPRKIGKGWVDADQVLPLLDGLDEVAKDARSACVQQINDYYQSRLEHGSSPIVVCCRSKEYAALSTRVMLQRAVGILPLTSEQINTYLEQAGEQVKGLRQALEEDAELYSLAHQPLILNIFTLAYQGTTAAKVPTGETREEMQHTVFTQYVERMLNRRGQSKRRKPEQVIRWLMFLAKQMQKHEQTVFSVENLQPTWLSREWRILYQWSVRLPGALGGLVFGLGVALVFTLVFGPGNTLVVGLGGTLIFALVFGLIFALVFGLVVVPDSRINLTEVLTWSRKKARSGSGLVIVLVVELVIVLVARGQDWQGGLVVELVFMLIFWLVFVPDTRINPAGVLIWSWKKARSGLVLGLVFALIVGLVLGLDGGELAVLIVALVFIPIFWLVFGLVLVLDTRINPAGALIWSWKKARSGLVLGLVFALIVRLVSSGLGGLILSLVVGLPVGLVIVLVRGLSRRQLSERLSLSPNEGIWHSGKYGLFYGLVFGLLAGLVFGLILGLGSGGLASGGLGGLVFGLGGGLVFAQVFGLRAFIMHFILRFFLSRQGDLPWDLVAFLDEAAGRLLLRKVSGSYIFVHRLLLDYFVAL